MTELYEASKKRSYFIVSMRYGDPVKWVRYTDWNSDLEFYGPGDPELATYYSNPTMAIDLGTRTGTLDEDPAKLSMPVLDDPLAPFIDRLSNGEKHPRVKVIISEVLFEQGVSVLKTRYRGYVDKTLRNFQGRRERVQIIVGNWKALLDVPMGISASPRCQNTLGKPPCYRKKGVSDKVDLELLKETATIISIEHDKVELASFNSKPTNKTYRRGFIRYDGLSIPIRIWNKGKSVVWLYTPPPADWNGQDVEVYPGCDRKYSTCKNLYGNNKQFLASGKLIPKLDPTLEKPSD